MEHWCYSLEYFSLFFHMPPQELIPSHGECRRTPWRGCRSVSALTQIDTHTLGQIKVSVTLQRLIYFQAAAREPQDLMEDCGISAFSVNLLRINRLGQFSLSDVFCHLVVNFTFPSWQNFANQSCVCSPYCHIHTAYSTPIIRCIQSIYTYFICYLLFILLHFLLKRGLIHRWK